MNADTTHIVSSGFIVIGIKMIPIRGMIPKRAGAKDIQINRILLNRRTLMRCSKFFFISFPNDRHLNLRIVPLK